MTQSNPHHHAQHHIKVLAIETDKELPDEGVFIDILVDASRQPLLKAYRGNALPMPTISVGTLAVFVNGMECTHAGVISLATETQAARDFRVAAWPLATRLRLPEGYFDRGVQMGRLSVRQCVRYYGVAQDDEGDIVCSVMSLPPELAVDLRGRVGLEVPLRLQNIYWGDAELEYLHRERAELDRFGNALQEELAVLNEQ